MSTSDKKPKNGKPEEYWRPVVMRHTTPKLEYAIHEMYFFNYGKELSWTENAVSDRFDSISELEASLRLFLRTKKRVINCGDRGYEFFRGDVKLWLKHINDAPHDYTKS